MKKKLAIVTLLAITTVLLLAVTSPNDAQLPVYFGLFTILYFFFALLISIFIDFSYSKIDVQKRRFAAIVLGFSPTILLALVSLSSITVIDFILAIGIPVAIVWYGIRGGSIK